MTPTTLKQILKTEIVPPALRDELLLNSVCGFLRGALQRGVGLRSRVKWFLVEDSGVVVLRLTLVGATKRCLQAKVWVPVHERTDPLATPQLSLCFTDGYCDVPVSVVHDLETWIYDGWATPEDWDKEN